MSFNFNYNYNENKGNSFYEMMGLNKKAVDNITESEDICGSYAPDYEFEKDNDNDKQDYIEAGNSIMNFTPFEDDITAIYDNNDNHDGVDYNI